jgi:cephalosporin-C deacetylase-like acetyl esterase
LNSLTTAPQVKAPAVFIVTARDLLVLPRYQYLVMNAYAGEKRCLVRETADHNSPITPADAAQLQKEMDWLWAREPRMK